MFNCGKGTRSQSIYSMTCIVLWIIRTGYSTLTNVESLVVLWHPCVMFQFGSVSINDPAILLDHAILLHAILLQIVHIAQNIDLVLRTSLLIPSIHQTSRSATQLAMPASLLVAARGSQ